MRVKTATAARKLPKQARSKATVDAILEAAAQLFVDVGVEKTTTNLIARRAGVSIGSLYQYFPNKDAILIALAEEVGERQFEALQAKLAELLSVDAPIEVATRELISAIIDAKRIEPALCRVMFEQVARLDPDGDPLGPWLRNVEQLVQAALEQRNQPWIGADGDAALTAFLVTHATHGIVHSILVSRQELLEDPRVVDQIVKLVLNYLEPAALPTAS